MQLVTYTRINRQYFAKGSGPTKKEWIHAIEKGEINGKIAMGKVWIDVDDFNSKDTFTAQSHANGRIAINLLD